MFFAVSAACVLTVLPRVRRMSMSGVGVVRSFFVIACLVVLGSFVMVLGGMCMVL